MTREKAAWVLLGAAAGALGATAVGVTALAIGASWADGRTRRQHEETPSVQHRGRVVRDHASARDAGAFVPPFSEGRPR